MVRDPRPFLVLQQRNNTTTTQQKQQQATKQQRNKTTTKQHNNDTTNIYSLNTKNFCDTSSFLQIKLSINKVHIMHYV